MTDGPLPRLRPFFPSAEDFRAATAPHFEFLVDDFGYTGPVIEDHPQEAYDLRYDRPGTSVLLSWEPETGFFACHFVPRLANGALDADYERWLSPNEILAVRGAPEESVTQGDFDDVDEAGYARVMARQARNLREYCADVLRGDWSIYEAAHAWFKEQAEL